VRDPEKRRLFHQFANTDATESCIEVVHERGQVRPASWPAEAISLEQFRQANARRSLEGPPANSNSVATSSWVRLGSVSDFPQNGGAAVKYGKVQLAVFNFTSRAEWYATQNMCPHRNAFVLSRGILGDARDIPKVACPLHKKTFSLVTGQSLQQEEYCIRTFAVRIDGDDVLAELPPREVLEQELSTQSGCRLATSCGVADGCPRSPNDVPHSTLTNTI
jgi:nitrite reductase (NADH) large subunit